MAERMLRRLTTSATWVRISVSVCEPDIDCSVELHLTSVNIIFDMTVSLIQMRTPSQIDGRSCDRWFVLTRIKDGRDNQVTIWISERKGRTEDHGKIVRRLSQTT